MGHRFQCKTSNYIKLLEENVEELSEAFLDTTPKVQFIKDKNL